MDQTPTPLAPPISDIKKTSRNPWKLFLVIGVVLIISIAVSLFLFPKIRLFLNQIRPQPEASPPASPTETSMTALSQPYILDVTIDSVSGNTLSVTATPPSVAQKKQYKVILGSETEIFRSRIFDDSSKPSQETALDVSNLENGKQIVVYTDSDINSSDTLNALKIEVIPPAP